MNKYLSNLTSVLERLSWGDCIKIQEALLSVTNNSEMKEEISHYFRNYANSRFSTKQPHLSTKLDI